MAYITAEWTRAYAQIRRLPETRSVQSDAALIEVTTSAGQGDTPCPAFTNAAAYCVVSVQSAISEIVLVRLNGAPVAGAPGTHAVWPGGSTSFYASPGDVLHWVAVSIPA